MAEQTNYYSSSRTHFVTAEPSRTYGSIKGFCTPNNIWRILPESSVSVYSAEGEMSGHAQVGYCPAHSSAGRDLGYRGNQVDGMVPWASQDPLKKTNDRHSRPLAGWQSEESAR